MSREFLHILAQMCLILLNEYQRDLFIHQAHVQSVKRSSRVSLVDHTLIGDGVSVTLLQDGVIVSDFTQQKSRRYTFEEWYELF